MPPPLTPEQVFTLAPDPSAAAAGRGLAVPGVWVSSGTNEAALWGECKGSGKTPYRTQIDLSEPAFRCSCPSRKFPCKHALGLMLLYAAQPAAVPAAEPPPWVTEWLTNRAAAATRKAAAVERPAPAADPAPAAQTAREQRVAAGMHELERWLEDQLRAGLAALQGTAPGAFDTFAARMVDAQAPGAARLLRAAGTLAVSGSGWQSRLLDRLARLHLLARAYANLAALPPEAQADVRTAVGFTQNQDELRAGPGVPDQWLVLGRSVELEDRLRVQRTWLWGMHSGRPALVLDFSAAGRPLDVSLTPGMCIEADLVFFAGAAPLRALVRERFGYADGAELPAAPLHEALGSYAAALAANPWLERYPLICGPCTLGRNAAGWHIADTAGRSLPLTPQYTDHWRLLARTGGRPFTLAAEWDGERLTPLCVQYAGQTVILS